MKKAKNETKILGVPFTTSSKATLLFQIDEEIRNERQTVIFTPNPQMLLRANGDYALQKLLHSSSINIPDGTGILLAAKVLRLPIYERVTGIDMAEDILALAQTRGYSVFLLGGKQGVARKAAAELKNKYPKLQVCGTHHGYFQKSGEQNERIIKKISSSGADILFVCFGFPTQEQWIVKNVKHLPSLRLAMGLGGSLDVWSGKIKRAPTILQKARLEWLWRTLCEPKRMRIFADIPVFLYLLEKQRRSAL